MKYLILILVIALTGCSSLEHWNKFPAILTRCRHEVYAQKEALEEIYPEAKVQIVSYEYWDEGHMNKLYHCEVRIWLDNEWKYLRNSNRLYHLWEKPPWGCKIIDVSYDNANKKSQDEEHELGIGSHYSYRKSDTPSFEMKVDKYFTKELTK